VAGNNVKNLQNHKKLIFIEKSLFRPVEVCYY